MKSRFFLLCLLLVALCGSCSKDKKLSKQAEEYAGDYYGVFTIQRSEENFTLDTAATIHFTQAQNLVNLVAESTFELTFSEDNRYCFDGSTPLDSDSRATLFRLCRLSEHYFNTIIEKATIEARFYSKSVAVKILFSDAGGIVGNATFTGSR